MNSALASRVWLTIFGVSALGFAACSSQHTAPITDNTPEGWYRGTLRTASGDEPIRYEIKNGIPTIEGDIGLPGSKVSGTGVSEKSFAIGTRDSVLLSGGLWANGVLPYRYDSSIPASARPTIEAAIVNYRINTAIDFYQDTSNSASDYLLFKDTGDGCHTDGLGHSGGANVVHLQNSGCISLDIVAHEIGHTLGLRHEMTRPDRDNYVVINWSNIQSGRAPQFDKASGNTVGPFDFNSIMLYPPNGFAIDPTKPTISLLDGGTYVNPQGTNLGLAPGDIATVNSLYPLYVSASPNVTSLIQGGSSVEIDVTTYLNNWTDHSTPVSIELTGLPNGVGALLLDTYGTKQLISAGAGATLGPTVVTVNARQGTEVHTAHFQLTVDPAIPPPPPPGAPGCTLQARCESEGKAIAGQYQDVSTLVATCAHPSGTLDVRWVNGSAVESLTPYAPSLAYPGTTTPGEYTVGVQSQGTASGNSPAVGSTATFTACNVDALGRSTCDAPSTASVPNCCVPIACSGSFCGAMSDGCGGTVKCDCDTGGTCGFDGKCSYPSTCKKKIHCPKGSVWDDGSCSCESIL